MTTCLRRKAPGMARQDHDICTTQGEPAEIWRCLSEITWPPWQQVAQFAEIISSVLGTLPIANIGSVTWITWIYLDDLHVSL